MVYLRQLATTTCSLPASRRGLHDVKMSATGHYNFVYILYQPFKHGLTLRVRGSIPELSALK
jgi:hypothetical protein